jgi:hypothetical protein
VARSRVKLTPDNAVLSARRWAPDGAGLPTYALPGVCPSVEYSQTLKASPVVANSSVEGDFCDQAKFEALAGCHCRLVAGYPWLASHRVTKSG